MKRILALLIITTLTMAAFKETIQVSRKYAVPILEHLDRTGLTRRQGDERVPGPRLQSPPHP